MARLPLYQSRNGLTVDKQTINAIEEEIRWCQVEVPQLLAKNLDTLVRITALKGQMECRRMAAGVYDPTQSRPDMAWKIPVRRITERYFYGWKVRRRGIAVWEVYNDSREAYYIEYGISLSGRRVRRPILKLAVRRTLDYMRATQAAHRFFSSVVGDPQHRHRSGKGFVIYAQSPPMRLVGVTGPNLPADPPSGVTLI
jgi:hypothetical protein